MSDSKSSRLPLKISPNMVKKFQLRYRKMLLTPRPPLSKYPKCRKWYERIARNTYRLGTVPKHVDSRTAKVFVYANQYKQTKTKLTKEDLMINRRGRVVSRRKHNLGMKNYKLGLIGFHGPEFTRRNGRIINKMKYKRIVRVPKRGYSSKSSSNPSLSDPSLSDLPISESENNNNDDNNQIVPLARSPIPKKTPTPITAPLPPSELEQSFQDRLYGDQDLNDDDINQFFNPNYGI